jgi:Leucine-rich repeat (LRR) protein
MISQSSAPPPDDLQIVYISPSLTGLVELQLANNRIKELAGQPTFPALESLNLDSNDLYHFHDINGCLGSLPLYVSALAGSNGGLDSLFAD